MESVLITDKHVLVFADEKLDNKFKKQAEFLKSNFCGIVLQGMENLNSYSINSDTNIYLCGNIQKAYDEVKISEGSILIIKELSYNYEDKTNIITLGEVPINIHNAGVYFPQLFDSEKDYFGSVTNEHKFQSLTESNKSGKAFRTGIYLTNIEQKNDEIKFRLLRCSSNLEGPTDNFRVIDRKIVDRVNNLSKLFFHDGADLNHVLAQVYENKILNANGDSNSKMERKAKIKEHSDKTKDMPRNGLIAFVSFYKNYNRKFADVLKNIAPSDNDQFDYCYKNTSILTRLRFRLKNFENHSNLQKQFDVLLYPNSVFLISLSANRLYTHEIVPSILPIDKLPTRLGYIIRCSKTEAIFKNNKTLIKDGEKYIELEEPEENGVNVLKELYRKENQSDEIITYEKFRFSLNKGDYLQPII